MHTIIEIDPCELIIIRNQALETAFNADTLTLKARFHTKWYYYKVVKGFSSYLIQNGK